MTVVTRDHQVEIGSSLVVCSRTEPVRRGSVENRDRRGRYGGRYARGARRFAGGAKTANFRLLLVAVLGISTVKSRIFAFSV